MAPTESFDIDAQASVQPGQTLLVGLSAPGMAGLTAADYLVRNLESDRFGHVAPDTLPAITPVENGVPRHHTRLYNLTDVDMTVLVGELYVPVWAARSFVDAVLEWVDTVDIEEIVILHGVPFPHGPDDHRVFHVATEAYRELRFGDDGPPPMGGGYLDGVPGELMSRRLSSGGPPTGVLTTPAHPPGPDVDAALDFLDTIGDCYDVSVDLQELEDLSGELRKQYAALADRMEELMHSEADLDRREFGEDRMFM